jgi:membrane associated rhomboid family serine protease
MVRYGAKVAPLVMDLGEVWRLFTANFLHRDALHIGLNMFVLFNVGGLLENAYRALDYLWLLLFSGLVTMAVSLGLADAVSLGASGMVFGCLGGVVVFGLKYRSILPSFYRRILSEAAIPTVLVFLWIGLTSDGVDNAAHAGGLLAGILTAPFLRPKLLAEAASSRWSPALRALPSVAMAVFILLGQSLLKGQLPVLQPRSDDVFGLTLPVPQGWRQGGADRQGELVFHNGLPGLGRATVTARAALMDAPADAAEQAQAFVDERLSPRALGPEVLAVAHDPPRPARVGDTDAVLVRAQYEEPSGSSELLAYFVPRGEVVHELVFTFPAEFPGYARVVEQMVQGTRLTEPSALRRARARTLLFPHAAWAQARLGEELRRFGDPFSAAEVLAAAVRAQPSESDYRVQLALALLQAGQVEPGCEASRAAVLYAPRDPRALEAAARCEVARGDAAAALEHLMQARAVVPADARLRRAEEALRAALRGRSAPQ